MSEQICSYDWSRRLKSGTEIQCSYKMEDEFLVLMHDDGDIDDEEFFILHEATRHSIRAWFSLQPLAEIETFLSAV